ncbi:hypothetical protein O3M35_005143 [Rhynocoris fuscipes]|uniref:Uncharacterized protein n=1 Tax=Rhynocoris fuscipes TaxID=488301 RepID=A0AAW1DII7_9HEMI
MTDGKVLLQLTTLMNGNLSIETDDNVQHALAYYLFDYTDNSIDTIGMVDWKEWLCVCISDLLSVVAVDWFYIRVIVAVAVVVVVTKNRGYCLVYVR